ncbi:MAG TPA: ROK family transcriptional regulator [Candidatus Pullichristensenella excrementigallinarum]|uniref:ROK family transcriptional regulator n=1 Tax=Candidatus Pullichristensenella excrementigallinarum TaxID=2840907 RepID=A0A9D1LDH7_9FIRM|nr:ROK family transcriptional regulator [Candidatus Pullichristensenella excrementigallinarum]
MSFSERGINNASVRVENRRKLTKLLYTMGALTRQELSAKLRLSLPTVNFLVQMLEEDGLIYYQTSAQSSTGGRIPNLVCFRYDAYLSVGIDVSQTHHRILIMDMKCAIIDQYNAFLRFEDSDAYWETVNARLESLLAKNHLSKKRILGVGIAIPGPVFHQTGKLDSWLLHLKEYNYQKLENVFGLPVFVENDANSAGFAEIWMREDIQDAAYLSVSKGVGGAIIRNRTIVHGINGLAGEFGHQIVVPNGRKCLCGRHGCLDCYCSTTLLYQECEGGISAFFEKKNGDARLAAIWESYLEYLAIGVTNIAIILDLPVIIGGEITPYIAASFDELGEKCARIDSFSRRWTSMYSLSHLGENGAAIGAALLPVVKHLEI